MLMAERGKNKWGVVVGPTEMGKAFEEGDKKKRLPISKGKSYCILNPLAMEKKRQASM